MRQKKQGISGRAQYQAGMLSALAGGVFIGIGAPVAGLAMVAVGVPTALHGLTRTKWGPKI